MASKEIQEIVDRLTAMDDTFFHKLVEDKDFCEELIQTVTGKKSIRLVEATAQKSLRNIKGRSVVLDAYCVDTANDNYDLEIQKKRTMTTKSVSGTMVLIWIPTLQRKALSLNRYRILM